MTFFPVFVLYVVLIAFLALMIRGSSEFSFLLCFVICLIHPTAVSLIASTNLSYFLDNDSSKFEC